MTVQLMLTCLCDAFYGEVGMATVRVLEHAGCTVHFPESQSCCGQPPFNSGDWKDSRRVAEHWLRVFTAEDAVIVTPSSSCAAMIREGYPLLFDGHRQHPAVYELAEFLVHQLGVSAWPVSGSGSLRQRIVYHRACHARSLHLSDEQEKLLASIPGLELVTLERPEQCCGFGGAFSVNHPTVSVGIGEEKLRTAIESGAATLVSGDMGCLMHLRGIIDRQGLALDTRHFAQVLAEAISD